MKLGKVALFKGKNIPHEIVTSELPVPGPGEILVSIEMCTICTSDVHTFYGTRLEPTPLVLGHEMIGTVARLGDSEYIDLNGNLLKEGDLITWSIFANPVKDHWVAIGLPQKSPDKYKYGHEKSSKENFYSGGFATHCLLKAGSHVIKLASNSNLSAFCPINCSLSTMVAAFRAAGSVNGKQVLITGAGMLGVHAIAYGQWSNASIDVLDINPNRLKTAVQFGARRAYLEVPSDIHGNYDVVIDTSGSLEAMAVGIKSLKIGGVAVWTGAVFPQDNLGIDTEQIIRNMITIRGVHNYNVQDFQNAVSFMSNNFQQMPFSQLVEAEFPLEKLDHAFTFIKEKKPYRVAVIPN